MKSNKQQQTYIKCLIGRNLQHIKESTGLRGKQFTTYVQQYLPKSYSRSQIYFLLDLYAVVSEYNRLAYVAIDTRTLKSQFRLVKKLLASDATYWKSVK